MIVLEEGGAQGLLIPQLVQIAVAVVDELVGQHCVVRRALPDPIILLSRYVLSKVVGKIIQKTTIL